MIPNRRRTWEPLPHAELVAGIATIALEKLLDYMTKPDADQQFTEALTALTVAWRMFVRALLARMLGGHPKIDPDLSRAIDAIFINTRNVARETLRRNEQLITAEQLNRIHLEDQIVGLEARIERLEHGRDEQPT